MKVSLKLPMFGMNMEEGTIARWDKRPGEAFRKGETLYGVETEKVVSDVEAPCDGILLDIAVPEGQVALVGEIVCNVEMAVG